MTKPVHVIGGGLAGSEAAWQIASAGVPVVLHEMRPGRGTRGAQDRRPRRARLLELLPLRRRRDERGRPAACRRCAALGSLDHARWATPTRCRPAARSRSTATASRTRSRRRSRRTRWSRIERGEIAGLPPAEWDAVIVATGPLTSAGPRRGHPARSPARPSLAFFDAIAPIVHRETIDMDVAWFQSRYDKAGPGGTGADYINCPLDRDQYEAFVDALIAGDKTELQGVGGDDALFRRLPADRGDGRARPRDAAAWADEAGRADQPAPPRREALRRRAAAPGQRARHAVQHGRLPDQAEARRAEPHLPHDPGPRGRRVRAARRPAPQHLPQLAEAARRDAAPEGRPSLALRRPDHRLRGLCRERRRRPDGRALGGSRGGSAGRSARCRRRRRSAP